MNWKKIISLVVGLAIVAFAVIKLKNNKEIAQSRIYQFDKSAAVIVKADTLQLRSINTQQLYSGTFEPNRETKVSAEWQGRISDIFVEVGSVVSKGQRLAQLDNVLLKLQLEAMEVQIEGLSADVKRYEMLAKTDAIQGVQLEKAILGLKAAQVQQAILQEQIKKTTILAPFSGIVTAKLAEEGAFAAPGVPLLQITDIGQLKFTVNVSENDLHQFKLQQHYSIYIDALSNLSLNGKVILIGSKANMGSSFAVQFVVNNTPDARIKSGMFGKAFLKSEEADRGLLLPAAALQGTAEQPQVYVIVQGKAVLKNIQLAKRLDESVVVREGLQAGDVIVTQGFINLFDGARVSIH